MAYIEGRFKGYFAEDKILIDNQWIFLESIRNVQILHEEKWSQVHDFAINSEEIRKHLKRSYSSACDSGNPKEVSWIEDFNQVEEWFD